MLPAFALVFAALLWGLSWWPLKHFHGYGIDGAWLVLVGYGSVGLALAPVIWRERTAWRPEARRVVLMALLGGYCNLAFAYAMIFGEVVRAMMLFYLSPVWGVLAGGWWLGERIDGRRWLGVALAIIGAVVVLEAWRVVATPPSWIDFLALSAGASFALNNALCRAAQGVPLGTKGAVIFVGCALMALMIVLFGGLPAPAVAASVWAWIFAFGVGGLLLATLATQWGVTRMETGRASVILTTELVVAVISATLVGGETLSFAEALGGLLILTAALLEATRREPR